MVACLRMAATILQNKKKNYKKKIKITGLSNRTYKTRRNNSCSYRDHLELHHRLYRAAPLEAEGFG